MPPGERIDRRISVYGTARFMGSFDNAAGTCPRHPCTSPPSDYLSSRCVIAFYRWSVRLLPCCYN